MDAIAVLLLACASSAAASDGSPASSPRAPVTDADTARCQAASVPELELDPCESAGGSASTQAARGRCLAGMRALQAADDEEALREFAELERLEPGAQSALRVARAAEQLGRYYEASDRLRAALDARGAQPLRAAQRGAAERRQRALTAYLEQLASRADAAERDDVQGVLRASRQAHRLRPSALTQQLVAHAALDAREYELAAFAAVRALEDPRVPLTSDEREELDALIAEAGKGLHALPVTLSHPAGEKVALSVEPALADPPGAARAGPLLRFETAEPAACRLELALRSGVWLVRAASAGHAELRTTLRIAPDEGPAPVVLQIPDAAPSAREAARWLRPATLGALGVGGAALAAAAIAGGLSYAKHEQSDRDCRDGCGPEGVAAMDSAIVAGNVATASWIVAGVGLGTASALWLGSLRKRPRERERARLSFSGTPRGLRARW